MRAARGAKLPKLWRKPNKKGELCGNWICKIKGTEVNLRTKILDGEDGAIERSKHAMNGQRSFKSDAERAADATVRLPPAPAIVPPPAAADLPPAPPPVQPDTVLPPPRLLPPISSDADAEAAATAQAAAETTAGDESSAGDGAPPGAAPPDLDELAELAVGGQVWIAAEYARRKVYRKFPTPELPDQATKKLAEQWKKIAEYGGISAFMPPWVTGLVIPGVVLLTSTFAMAKGFAAAAEEQKRKDAAGGAADPSQPLHVAA